MTRTLLATLAAFAAVSAIAASEKRRDADLYRPYLEKHRRPVGIEYPEDNGFTADREILGRTLFFDPRPAFGSFVVRCAIHPKMKLTVQGE